MSSDESAVRGRMRLRKGRDALRLSETAGAGTRGHTSPRKTKMWEHGSLRLTCMPVNLLEASCSCCDPETGRTEAESSSESSSEETLGSGLMSSSQAQLIGFCWVMIAKARIPSELQ